MKISSRDNLRSKTNGAGKHRMMNTGEGLANERSTLVETVPYTGRASDSGMRKYERKVHRSNRKLELVRKMKRP